MDKEYSSITDREVYVEKAPTTVTTTTDDSGTGWAVALIVLILAIGFGFVAFSNNQAASELRTTQAVEEVRRDALSNTFPPVTPSIPAVPNPSASSSVEVKVPEIKVPEIKAPEVNVQTEVKAPEAPAVEEPAPSDAAE